MSVRLARSTPANKNVRIEKIMQAFLESAIAAGSAPRKTPSDAVILRRGGEHRVLVNIAGNLTAAGRAYQELTGAALETQSYDPNQTTTRSGNVEYIKMRRGKEKAVRTYDPATGEFTYTALGKREAVLQGCAT